MGLNSGGQRDTAQGWDPENHLALVNFFGNIRDRPSLLNNDLQQTILDQIMTQLLDEANARAKGPPPAAKSFIENLKTISITREMAHRGIGRQWILSVIIVRVLLISDHYLFALSTFIDISAELSCSICVETFRQDGVAKELPCNHKFHAGCILPWLELHNTCPICRAEFPTDEPVEKKEGQHRQQPVVDDDDDDPDWMYG
ncbi:hypothetical protein HK102_014187 [Quaeritorhiza haematococci]|nr:hypothetical protein HK102_014187 [Quaeritorhiza haematococci]